MYTYRIVNNYPHDPHAYTQGLEYHQGILYESTGLFGRSSLRKVELKTGRVLQSYNLPEVYFGEGITIWKDTVIQLTWRNGKGFVYDKDSLTLLHEFSYATEGWGITHDGTRLIMSDGSSYLYYLDPANYRIIGRVQVKDTTGLLDRINELEYIKGQVYANIWGIDMIAIINPHNGSVTGWINLAGLLETGYHMAGADILNGIAYDESRGNLLVTGKLWPALFEIAIIPKNGSP